MKIYLTADIEGTCGIVHWDETEIDTGVGAYHREQMTKEVSAACVGANSSGAKSILVKDSHGSARSINPSLLPENTNILRGWARNPYRMMAGLDKSFDATLYIGYHCGAGQNGNPLSHTMNGNYDYVKINGEIVNEFIINAYTSAYFGVPIAFVSGDKELCESAKRINPNIVTASVCEGIGEGSISIHPNVALQKIQEGVNEALSGDLSRHTVELPDKFEVEIRYRHHFKAYHSSFYPGVKQIDNQTIKYETNDYYEFLRMFFFIQ